LLASSRAPPILEKKRSSVSLTPTSISCADAALTAGAAATIAGQNLGAGNPERAKHGVAVASRFGLAVAAVVGLLFLIGKSPPALGVACNTVVRLGVD